MKCLNKTSFAFILSAYLLSINAWAEQYQFKFQADLTADLQQIPKVIPNHEVTINGQRIHAFDTAFSDPLGDENDRIDFKTQEIHTKIKAEVLERLELYAMPNGSVFVPKGWKLVQGAIGANGTQSYRFSAPSGKGYLTFYDASACVGCAQSAASVFFSEAYQKAKENDFTAYDSTNLPMKSVRLKPNLIAYSVEQNEQRLDGVAYYNANSDFPFWQAEVSLPAKERDLANPLLNQFISLAKDK